MKLSDWKDFDIDPPRNTLVLLPCRCRRLASLAAASVDNISSVQFNVPQMHVHSPGSQAGTISFHRAPLACSSPQT